MKKVRISDRIRYAFDNLMAKGAIAQIISLFIFTVIVVAIFSVLVWVAGITPEESIYEQFWSYLAITLEADALTGEPWLFRISTFIVTLVAIFITSILIGLLATGIEAKIEELRKGRSQVIEKDHTVILGWTPAIFPIISELVLANANRKNPAIVILGQKDKIEMEDEIREKVGDTANTKVVCRTGDPMAMADLDITSINSARSIIILGAEKEAPDIGVIKSLLAITNNPNRRTEPYHIVAEINERKNILAAKIAAQGEAKFVLSNELLSRITAQTSRQSGLSVAYVELMDFGGDEIYQKEEPQLVGKSFGEILDAYETSTVIGLLSAGKAKLNPPMTSKLKAGDEVIAISEDDDTVILSGKSNFPVQRDLIVQPVMQTAKPENIILLGFNQRAPLIIQQLDAYVPQGSKLTIVSAHPNAKAQIASCCEKVKNLKVTHLDEDCTSREVLENLPFTDDNNFIVLSSASALEPQQSDARTLISLLHLRDIKEKRGIHMSIVSEILDMRNQILAEVAQADDFVVSDRLTSLMLTQISENQHLAAIFDDILDAEGSEIYIKPITNYVKVGEAVNFYTLIEAARQRGEVAIGYRLAAQSKNAKAQSGVVLNPYKADAHLFSQDDYLIVVSEN